MGQATRLTGDIRSLGNKQRARSAGALSVVFKHHVRWDMCGVVAKPRQGWQHNPMGERDVADADGLEKRRRRGRGHVEQCVVVE